MLKHHQVVWYWPGKVNPKEFRFRPLTFMILLFVPIIFTGMFVLGVVFFVSFSLRMDELQTLRTENETIRAELGRVFEIERQLDELEQFQAQVRRGLTEGADLQRIMEAGEAVEWEHLPDQQEVEWMSINSEVESFAGDPLNLLAINDAGIDGFSLPDRWPLDGIITRGFEFTHIDPENSHTGIDLATPRGTPVIAVAGGTVVSADWTPRYGNRAIVDHGGGMLSMYGHNELLLVEVGDRISSGAPIALSGNSGISTAPHLHLERWLNGKAVDPRALLPQKGEHDEEG
jgi:murein DD-endopeptidase MepM/ murein hydrolase activator NlpD